MSGEMGMPMAEVESEWRFRVSWYFNDYIPLQKKRPGDQLFCAQKGREDKQDESRQAHLFCRPVSFEKIRQADRGGLLLGDEVGPVGSSVLDAADLNENKLEEDCLKYARNFLSHPKGDVKLQNVISKKEVDLDVFSQSDIEAFEVAFKEFGDKDQFELAELSHRYPEWAKHKSRIEAGHSQVRHELC